MRLLARIIWASGMVGVYLVCGLIVTVILIIALPYWLCCELDRLFDWACENK